MLSIYSFIDLYGWSKLAINVLLVCDLAVHLNPYNFSWLNHWRILTVSLNSFSFSNFQARVTFSFQTSKQEWHFRFKHRAASKPPSLITTATTTQRGCVTIYTFDAATGHHHSQLVQRQSSTRFTADSVATAFRVVGGERGRERERERERERGGGALSTHSLHCTAWQWLRTPVCPEDSHNSPASRVRHPRCVPHLRHVPHLSSVSPPPPPPPHLFNPLACHCCPSC